MYYRWVCKHFGRQSASYIKRRGYKRAPRSVLPCGCSMSIHVSLDRVSKKYVVRRLNTDHNHATGPAEFASYATNRRPDAELLRKARLMMQHGMKASSVKQYLHMHGAKVTIRDVYNLRLKMSLGGHCFYLL